MCTDLKCNNLVLKLNSDKPDVQVEKKALLELRETPENICKGLAELKSLLKAETDLIAPTNDDEWLLMFLRTCKFYPESARDLIKRLYNLRRKYSEISLNLQPSKLKYVFDAGLVSMLPQRDQHGRRMVVTLGGKQWDYKTVPFDDIFRCSILCTDILQKEPESQINGIVYILDLDGLSFWHALQYTPYVVKRCLDFVQDNAPIRVKGFHIVNQPKIFQPIFAAVKPFFSKKFSKRIIMHGSNYKSLHQYISPECLPICYGGTLQSKLMYSQETYQLLAEHEELFVYLQQFGFKAQ